MGWYFGYTDRETIRREITHDYRDRSCWVGNVLWVCHSADDCDLKKPFIGCYLLERRRRHDWGYKPMDETMFPYRFSCPLAYLEAVPDPEFVDSTRWRAAVRRYRAERSSLKRGSRRAISPPATSNTAFVQTNG